MDPFSVDEVIRYAKARLESNKFMLDRGEKYDKPDAPMVKFQKRDVERWKLIVKALEEYKANHEGDENDA